MIINIHERREVNKCSARPKVRLARGREGEGGGGGNVTWWRDEEGGAPRLYLSEGAPSHWPAPPLPAEWRAANGWTRPGAGSASQFHSYSCLVRRDPELRVSRHHVICVAGERERNQEPVQCLKKLVLSGYQTTS